MSQFCFIFLNSICGFFKLKSLATFVSTATLGFYFYIQLCFCLYDFFFFFAFTFILTTSFLVGFFFPPLYQWFETYQLYYIKGHLEFFHAYVT